MDNPYMFQLSILNLSLLNNFVSEHAETGNIIFLVYKQRIDKFCDYF